MLPPYKAKVSLADNALSIITSH